MKPDKVISIDLNYEQENQAMKRYTYCKKQNDKHNQCCGADGGGPVPPFARTNGVGRMKGQHPPCTPHGDANIDTPPLKVALIGPGMIGIDLLYKIKRSNLLKCVLVAGRNPNGKGLTQAKNLGFETTAKGIDGLIRRHDKYDLVFDATDAAAHMIHWARLKELNKKVIDLTPSRIGHMVAPTESVPEDFTKNNINLISCGGQATIPILASISREFGGLEYVEIITTASSPSVGRATRNNIDEYIHTAERAIKKYTKVPVCKAILNISAAHPPVPFRVAMHVCCKNFELDKVREVVKKAESRVQAYAGGYRLLTCEKMSEGRLYISVEVEGQGDFIPQYSGNLDIINSSAIALAEKIAMSVQPQSILN